MTTPAQEAYQREWDDTYSLNGPSKTPEKVAQYLKVHANSDRGHSELSDAVQVDYLVREKTDSVGREGDPEEIPEVVAEWLKEQRERIEESGGTLLEHRVIPCEFRVDDPPLMDMRDCDFVVASFPELADDAV
jgi:hypothetical protein